MMASLFPSLSFRLQHALIPRAVRYLCSHKEIWGEGTDDYTLFGKRQAEVTEKYKSSPNRYQQISTRQDRSELSIDAIKAQCKGKYFITHRGCHVVKSADDIMVFQQVLWDLRPATVIELGTFTGGSAIWMADMLRIMEVESHIYSMDIDTSLIDGRVKELQPDNVSFLQGDSYAIEKTFTDEFLKSLPHPWLIAEDSHTNVYGVLQYFHQYMQTGDYFIVEDLNPDVPCNFGYGRIFPVSYNKAGSVGINILKQFLSDYSHYYAVDSFYTDFFGYNGTWNWHGYIRRM